jgi:hypothetical protein
MNLEGDLTWYLSVLYTRCPITGTVTASQERYIDKLLQQHGMQNCNPVAVPFPAKCDDILAQLATPIENPDPKLVKEFQTLCGGLLYLQVHTSNLENIYTSAGARSPATHLMSLEKSMAGATPALPMSSHMTTQIAQALSDGFSCATTDLFRGGAPKRH